MKIWIFLASVVLIAAFALWPARPREKPAEIRAVATTGAAGTPSTTQIASAPTKQKVQETPTGSWNFPGYEYLRLGPGVSRWSIPKGRTNHILQIVVDRRLPLTSEEAMRCQAAYDDVAKMRQEAELKNAEVEVVSDTQHIIRIKAYAEGPVLEASLAEDFRAILGADRAALLLKAARSAINDGNNYWGAEDQVIDVRYQPTEKLYEFSHGKGVPAFRVSNFTVKNGVQVSVSRLRPSDLSIYAYLEPLLPAPKAGP